MNQFGWVSLVALGGWLILALSSYRAHRIGASKTLVMALVWLAIFALALAIFVTMGACRQTRCTATRSLK